MALLIRGGTVVNHDHSRRADVLIEGDTIVAVAAAIAAPTGAETIDAGGAYVIPGGIDPHTHLEMPFMGTVTADDFESGTKAALSGGTTMVVDFACPIPVSRCSLPTKSGGTNPRRRPPTTASTWR